MTEETAKAPEGGNEAQNQEVLSLIIINIATNKRL